MSSSGKYPDEALVIDVRPHHLMNLNFLFQSEPHLLLQVQVIDSFL